VGFAAQRADGEVVTMPARDLQSFVVEQQRDVHWTVRSDCAEWFLTDIAPHYQQIEKEKGVEVIKQSMRRVVCRVGPPLARDGNLIIKRQAFSGVSYFLKYVLLRNKAAQEWRIAWRLAEANIPSFMPVALGERRKWGSVTECCLVAEEISGAEKLSRYTESLGQQPETKEKHLQIRRLLRDLAQLLGRLNGAGIYHPDLHGANILVRPKGETAYDLFLIDLHAVWQMRGLLSWHEHRTLALLARGLYVLRNDAKLATLIADYQQARGRKRESWRKVFPAVKRQMRKRQCELFEARDRRCMRTSTNFIDRRDNDCRIIFRRILADHPLVTDPLDKSSRVQPNLSKQYEVTEYADHLKARAVWRTIHGLRLRRQSAPRPHVLVESHDPKVPSCILTEIVPDARLLSERLEEYPAVAKGQVFVEKTTLHKAVAKRLSAACVNGVKHRECIASSLIVARGKNDWDVLFDLTSSVTFKRHLNDNEKIDMLVQFAASVPSFTRTAAWRFYQICFRYSRRWMRRDVVGRIWRKVHDRLSSNQIMHNGVDRKCTSGASDS